MTDESNNGPSSTRLFWAVALTLELVGLVLVCADVMPVRKAMPWYSAWMLIAMAVFAAIDTFVIQPRAIVKALRTLKFDVTPYAGEASGFRDAAPVTKVVVNPDKAVLLALEERASVFNGMFRSALMLSVVGFYFGAYRTTPLLWGPFFVVAIVLQLALFPRRSLIARFIERATGARCKLADRG
jgi:hypothetical protein